MQKCNTRRQARLSEADYRLRAEIAQALANANRLRILDALADGERCVCELVETLGCDQSTASKHLSLLRGAGLVEDRKDGARVYYRLACPCVTGFFDCIEEVVANRAEALRR